MATLRKSKNCTNVALRESDVSRPVFGRVEVKIRLFDGSIVKRNHKSDESATDVIYQLTEEQPGYSRYDSMDLYFVLDSGYSLEGCEVMGDFVEETLNLRVDPSMRWHMNGMICLVIF